VTMHRERSAGEHTVGGPALQHAGFPARRGMARVLPGGGGGGAASALSCPREVVDS
jgi:hypothetical protein